MDENMNPQDSGNPAPESLGAGTRATGPLPELDDERPVRIRHRTSGGRLPRQQRARLVPGLILVATLLLGMVFGGAGAEVATLALAGSPVAAAAGVAALVTPPSGQPIAQLDATTISSVYQKVSPSVVLVDSMIKGNGRFGASGEATGTGVVIDAQGDILTNYHVIQGASAIKITLVDGSTYTASVVGSAPQNDLAVLQAAIPSDKLVPARLGDSAAVQAGDAVIAIGYPYGLDQSVTSGIVSGLNRDAQEQGNRTLNGLIQSDAAINPGNSGGPLLNTAGQVIGINTMIESPVEGFTGIGLAIPINQVKQLLPQLTPGT